MPSMDTDTNISLDILSQAMHDTHIGVTIADLTQPHNPLVYANKAFLDMTGYDKDEVLGQNCRFLQGPKTKPATKTLINSAIQNGDPVSIKILNYRKNGEPFWNQLELSPLRNSNNDLIAYCGFQIDLTTSQAAQRQSGPDDIRGNLARIAGKV